MPSPPSTGRGSPTGTGETGIRSKRSPSWPAPTSGAPRRRRSKRCSPGPVFLKSRHRLPPRPPPARFALRRTSPGEACPLKPRRRRGGGEGDALAANSSSLRQRLPKISARLLESLPRLRRGLLSPPHHDRRLDLARCARKKLPRFRRCRLDGGGDDSHRTLLQLGRSGSHIYHPATEDLSRRGERRCRDLVQRELRRCARFESRGAGHDLRPCVETNEAVR